MVVKERVVCAKCGKPTKKTLFANAGIGLCADCTLANFDEVQRANRIEGYSYKPHPKFTTAHADKAATKRFFGFELELQWNNQSERPSDGSQESNPIVKNKIPMIVNFTSKGLVYGKSDSSIGLGIELVSHPLELGALGKIHPRGTKGFIEMLTKLGLKDSNCCGLHIHVSRNSFGSVLPDRTDADRARGAAMKINKFFAEHADKVSKMAFRKDNNFGYARLPEKLHDSLAYIENSPMYLNSDDRRKALNPTANTFEFRLFGATLDHTRFIGAFHFIDTLADFTNLSCLFGCTWDNYVKYLESRNDDSARKVLALMASVGV